MADACIKTGVKHLVFSSTESALKQSGIPVDHLDSKGEVTDSPTKNLGNLFISVTKFICELSLIFYLLFVCFFVFLSFLQTLKMRKIIFSLAKPAKLY